jgi:hypothetical protein
MDGRMVGDVKKGWEIGTQSSLRKETNTLASNRSNSLYIIVPLSTEQAD